MTSMIKRFTFTDFLIKIIPRFYSTTFPRSLSLCRCPRICLPENLWYMAVKVERALNFSVDYFAYVSNEFSPGFRWQITCHNFSRMRLRRIMKFHQRPYDFFGNSVVVVVVANPHPPPTIQSRRILGRNSMNVKTGNVDSNVGIYFVWKKKGKSKVKMLAF